MIVVRVLIISDIHANIHALESVINSVDKYDYIVFVGDSVDYGPNPVEVVDWLRENADIAVMGNHDNAVAWNVDCKCGEKTWELSVYSRKNISLRLLDKNHIEFLRKLPSKASLTLDDLDLFIVHGSPKNPLYGYVYPSLNDAELLEELKVKSLVGSPREINADFVILGHTHISMYRIIENKVIINPGSVGQPRDGDNRASYGILDTKNKSFEIKRIKYPIDKVIDELKKLKLEKRYEKWIINLLLMADVDKARESL